MASAAGITVELAEAVLPREAVAELAEFLAQGVSGKVEIDVSNGRIMAMRLTKSVRLDKPKT